MVICEALLLTLSILIGLVSTYTDMKTGLIYNKALAIAAVVGTLVNAVYYSIFAKEWIGVFLLNLVFVGAIAFALYCFHFWAAGDTKLLVLIIYLFPGRFLDAGSTQFMSGIILLVLVFLIAYVYILGDTLIKWITNAKRLGQERIQLKKSGIAFLKSYAIAFLYMRAINAAFALVIPGFYGNNLPLFAFISMFISILINSRSFYRNKYCIGVMVLINVAIAFFNWSTFSWRALVSYLILLSALILRYLANQYNYEEVAADSVKKGMVMAYSTVALFSISRVKGLPQTTHEDMSTRITEEEADAIRRWKDSKRGQDTIVIVRKIPFAVFIFLGGLMFMVVRILL